MRRRAWLAAALACTALAARPSRADGPAAATQAFVVSVPDLVLERGETVARFELTLARGRILALPKVPWPWRVAIRNQETGGAKLTGTAELASTNLKADFFDGFVEIDAPEGSRVTLEIDTTRDGERTHRELRYTRDRLVLRARP